MIQFITANFKEKSQTILKKTTDYREKGRDESGYRSVHMILERDSKALELQIRSRIQHYWSESIERTSVIYGKHLKETDGDPRVISYFKALSDVFFEIEGGREPDSQTKLSLDQMRESAQDIIYNSDQNRIFDSAVNEDIVQTLTAIQGVGNELTNWIMVFDWKTGDFQTWDKVGREIESAMAKYIDYEHQFPAEQGFEVVMIGASDISTIRQTHSHYFGIEKFDNILENLEQSIAGFKKRMDIDVGSRRILSLLVRRKYWGKKSISADTLRNHLVKGLLTFDASIQTLRDKQLINSEDSQSPISLNLKKKSEIQAYL